jgi:hypothetical protein
VSCAIGNTARADAGLLYPSMTIDRDDREERQARLDRMINEFQEARRRRLAQASGGAVKSHTKTEAATAACVNRRHHPDGTDL